jgi:D-amino-acid dehydrogenase
MKAVIVGGGIIGLSCAYYLNKTGWDVSVVDKSDLSDSCSYGNLGMVVPSHFVPLAAPGMIAQGIRWMFNNKSPFYVKPALSMDLLSWGLKFIRSASEHHVNASAQPLLELNLLSKQLYEDLAAEPGFDFGLQNRGIMMYYKNEKVGEEEIHLAEKARSMGLDVQPLQTKELQGLEPALDFDVLGAVHYRCDSHLSPNALMPQLIKNLKETGVSIQAHNSVTRFLKAGKKIHTVVTTKGELQADVVVMAGGSWLPQLARMAGVSLSLMPGKGYSFTVSQPHQTLNIPAILCEARVAITPMNGQMRYGGTMEIGPLNNKINMNRVRGIVESVPKYFRNLQLQMPEEKEVWYGFRPVTPDGLPYLGAVHKVENLLIAGGHAMSGLSLGPATGKVIADLANGRKTVAGIKAFDPERFS